MNNNTQAYYYLPDELFKKDYRGFSNESKLLFGMLLTNMSTASAVMDTAKLIEELGVRKISSMHKNLEAEIEKAKEREVS